ncbi:glycosyltransferase family 2 protein [Fulvivirga sedimenti]|uniref:Glycosyltransferase family 2 protein n=1 Tax=Fulvivirga sedimenti TaxID=2879465 RepID=A0A9X1HX52_9BACT|nr:glycosyltransferase family 2 protein [Fulvivirga sedimenti]MCA6078052.1 glycosyltransferase family 2 protein [Fulvivirga sedimenti]
MIVKVIIPAYNEEKSVAHVLSEIPMEIVDEVVVVNNASTDNTRSVAEKAGATVLDESVPGYGKACLTGIEYLAGKPVRPDIVVFMDADYSDYPEELPMVIGPILSGNADLVIGSRALGDRERGSMTPQQVFGNWLATRILYWKYGARFTDLGPFRAIRFDRLLELGMQDKNYGWTVEMQIRAAKQGLSFTEVPVRYRKRIGFSKVSGTLKGTVMAGYKILWTLFTYG